MDEHGLARVVGWVSPGLGLALVATPARTVKQPGMGERPRLGRLLGARDLALGAGLLRGGSEATWLRANGVADALDAALIPGGLSIGAFPKSWAAVGLATATGFAVLSFLSCSPGGWSARLPGPLPGYRAVQRFRGSGTPAGPATSRSATAPVVKA